MKNKIESFSPLIKKIKKVVSVWLCFTFLFTQCGFAQVGAELNISGFLSRLGNNVLQDRFRPLHLRYFSYDTASNNFRIFVDKGGQKDIKDLKFEESSKELLKYFLIGVTLPNSNFWVNLRPDSPNKIIDDNLAKTDIGKILLETDVQLKKDTARFTSPETIEGKQYWQKLYKKAGELFGNENITIPTLTRPWIVPNEIIIRETKDSAYIYKATLKVMLEEDYLKNLEKIPNFKLQAPSSNGEFNQYNFSDPRLKILNEYSTQLIRESIIPKLNKEVNSSKRYSALRQVFYSLVLSRWFKERFNGKAGVYSDLINKADLTSLTSKENWSKDTYFKEYQKSFKDGEYNIKEQVYTAFGPTIRSYFSGGVDVTQFTMPGPVSSPAGADAGTYIGSSPALERILGKDGGMLNGKAGSSPIIDIRVGAKYRGIIPAEDLIGQIKSNSAIEDISGDTTLRLTIAELLLDLPPQLVNFDMQEYLQGRLAEWVQNAEKQYKQEADKQNNRVSMASFDRNRANRLKIISEEIKQVQEKILAILKPKTLAQDVLQSIRTVIRAPNKKIALFTPSAEMLADILQIDDAQERADFLVTLEDEEGIYILNGLLEFLRSRNNGGKLESALLMHAGVERFLMEKENEPGLKKLFETDPELKTAYRALVHLIAEDLERIILNIMPGSPEFEATNSLLDTVIIEFAKQRLTVEAKPPAPELAVVPVIETPPPAAPTVEPEPAAIDTTPYKKGVTKEKVKQIYRALINHKEKPIWDEQGNTQGLPLKSAISEELGVQPQTTDYWFRILRTENHKLYLPYRAVSTAAKFRDKGAIAMLNEWVEAYNAQNPENPIKLNGDVLFQGYIKAIKFLKGAGEIQPDTKLVTALNAIFEFVGIPSIEISVMQVPAEVVTPQKSGPAKGIPPEAIIQAYEDLVKHPIWKEDRVVGLPMLQDLAGKLGIKLSSLRDRREGNPELGRLPLKPKSIEAQDPIVMIEQLVKDYNAAHSDQPIGASANELLSTYRITTQEETGKQPDVEKVEALNRLFSFYHISTLTPPVQTAVTKPIDAVTTPTPTAPEPVIEGADALLQRRIAEINKLSAENGFTALAEDMAKEIVSIIDKKEEAYLDGVDGAMPDISYGNIAVNLLRTRLLDKGYTLEQAVKICYKAEVCHASIETAIEWFNMSNQDRANKKNALAKYLESPATVSAQVYFRIKELCVSYGLSPEDVIELIYELNAQNEKKEPKKIDGSDQLARFWYEYSKGYVVKTMVPVTGSRVPYPIGRDYDYDPETPPYHPTLHPVTIPDAGDGTFTVRTLKEELPIPEEPSMRQSMLEPLITPAPVPLPVPVPLQIRQEIIDSIRMKFGELTSGEWVFQMAWDSALQDVADESGLNVEEARQNDRIKALRGELLGEAVKSINLLGYAQQYTKWNDALEAILAYRRFTGIDKAGLSQVINTLGLEAQFEAMREEIELKGIYPSESFDAIQSRLERYKLPQINQETAKRIISAVDEMTRHYRNSGQFDYGNIAVYVYRNKLLEEGFTLEQAVKICCLSAAYQINVATAKEWVKNLRITGEKTASSPAKAAEISDSQFEETFRLLDSLLSIWSRLLPSLNPQGDKSQKNVGFEQLLIMDRKFISDPRAVEAFIKEVIISAVYSELLSSPEKFWESFNLFHEFQEKYKGAPKEKLFEIWRSFRKEMLKREIDSYRIRLDWVIANNVRTTEEAVTVIKEKLAQIQEELRIALWEHAKSQYGLQAPEEKVVQKRGPAGITEDRIIEAYQRFIDHKNNPIWEADESGQDGKTTGLPKMNEITVKRQGPTEEKSQAITPQAVSYRLNQIQLKVGNKFYLPTRPSRGDPGAIAMVKAWIEAYNQNPNNSQSLIASDAAVLVQAYFAAVQHLKSPEQMPKPDYNCLKELDALFSFVGIPPLSIETVEPLADEVLVEGIKADFQECTSGNEQSGFKVIWDFVIELAADRPNAPSEEDINNNPRVIELKEELSLKFIEFALSTIKLEEFAQKYTNWLDAFNAIMGIALFEGIDSSILAQYVRALEEKFNEKKKELKDEQRKSHVQLIENTLSRFDFKQFARGYPNWVDFFNAVMGLPAFENTDNALIAEYVRGLEDKFMELRREIEQESLVPQPLSGEQERKRRDQWFEWMRKQLTPDLAKMIGDGKTLEALLSEKHNGTGEGLLALLGISLKDIEGKNAEQQAKKIISASNSRPKTTSGKGSGVKGSEGAHEVVNNVIRRQQQYAVAIAIITNHNLLYRYFELFPNRQEVGILQELLEMGALTPLLKDIPQKTATGEEVFDYIAYFGIRKSRDPAKVWRLNPEGRWVIKIRLTAAEINRTLSDRIKDTRSRLPNGKTLDDAANELLKGSRGPSRYLEKWAEAYVPKPIPAPEETNGTGQGQSASSPVRPADSASKVPETTGGIDFATMNMITQPMGSFCGLDFSLPMVKDIEKINIEQEFQQLKNMLQGGMSPSGDRIKELVAVCYYRKELNARSEDLLACVMDTCKLEEMQACESSAQLKEALVILDAWNAPPR